MLRTACLLSCLCLLAQLAACQSGERPSHSMQKPAPATFELSAGPAAADGYPATIHRGNFILPDGSTLPIASGQLLLDSWGASGTGMPGARVPAPDSLELLWFSYADDKFYEGHFLLPQARMQALLQQGTWDPRTQKHETYKELTVCLLPTGGVVLWLSGLNQVLIGRYQATETAFDFKLFNPGTTRAALLAWGRSQMPEEVQAQVATGKLSAKKWDDYLARYPWKIEFNQPLQLYDYGVDFLNAEVIGYPEVPDPKAAGADLNATPFRQQLLAASPKPVPRKLTLFVQGTYGARHQLRIAPFDEAETMAAFRVLHAADAKSPITLLIEVDSLFRKASLTLRNDAQRIKLQKSTVQLFVE